MPNLDLVLDKKKEHHHNHLHHDSLAEKGKQDDVVYLIDTTGEKNLIPNIDSNDDELQRRHHPERYTAQPIESKGMGLGIECDEEKGSHEASQEEPTDPQRHKIARLYSRYRILVHLFIWLLFTG